MRIRAGDFREFLEYRLCKGKIDAGDKAVARPLFPAFRLVADGGVLSSTAVDQPYGYIYGRVTCPAETTGEVFEILDGLEIARLVKAEFPPDSLIEVREEEGRLLLTQDDPLKIMEYRLTYNQLDITNSTEQVKEWDDLYEPGDPPKIGGIPFPYSFVPDPSELKRLVKTARHTLQLTFDFNDGNLFVMAGDPAKDDLVSTRQVVIEGTVPSGERLQFEGLLPIFSTLSTPKCHLYQNSQGDWSMWVSEEGVDAHYLIAEGIA